MRPIVLLWDIGIPWTWGSPGSWLIAFFNAVREGVWSLWVGIRDWALQFGISCMDWMLAKMDPGWDRLVGLIEPFKPYLHCANLWLPIDLALQLLVVWSTVFLCALGCRLLFKFIPGLG